MLLIVKYKSRERKLRKKLSQKKKSQKAEPEDLENLQAYQYCKKFSKG